MGGSSASRRLCIAALCLLSVAGCVERRLTIRSDPPGATVILDGREIGRTPIERRHFMHYGTRDIVLARSKDAQSKTEYQRLRTVLTLKPPLYERFPLDLFFELAWPFTLVDDQEFAFALKPLKGRKSEDLDARAEEMRRRLAPGPPEKQRETRDAE